jgi:amidase
MDELCYLTARALAGRMRRRETSAAEILAAHAERIARLNPSINAVVSADLDGAARAATEADRAAGEGGPLLGVPMVIKDGHDVAGLRTTIGTEVYDRVPDRDGTVAARLKAAGAIILGHSNVPPFLAEFRTDNPIFGRTNNPWDLSRTPGGSSGGAAAALAAGLTPIEVASDFAGSMRLPPHFCGVYALMPTDHRVPTTGFWRALDGMPRTVRMQLALGPMARDLDDLDLVLRVIAGPDGRDTEVPPVPLRDRRRRTVPELRLAVATALPGADVATTLRDHIEQLAARACDAGARVEERLPRLDWEEQRLSGELLAAVTGAFDPDAHTDLAWYLTALDRRDRFAAAWEDFFGDLDALIVPPATTTAFRHEEIPDPGQGRQMVFANFAGLPALTVPAGHNDHGLPVGVQITGPRWSEIRLLEVAAALEEAGILPGFTQPPGY